MNLTDIVFILLVLAFLALGFFQGTIKLLIAIISFYVSIILASLYFQLVGSFFRQRFRTNLEVGQITAFGVILMVAFLLLTFAGLYTFRYARMPPSLDFVDRIVGTLLGLVMGGLILGMLAEILHLLLIVRSPANEITFPIMRALQSSVRQSFLVGFFGNSVLPLVFNIVRPLIPPEAYFLFRVQ
ncbi:MAG TPA: CvpA family protein [Roseiflexaceae bacterium]|nr:CvpA family protein [Roseiflexaceae bacterium]